MSTYLRFWGVRGSLPMPAGKTTRIGGNTPCVEIALSSGEIILIDCGTGARAAGLSLCKRKLGEQTSLHILLSHFHWDHIQGLPHFAPLFDERFRTSFYSHVSPRRLTKLLGLQMSSPFFPASFEDLVNIGTTTRIAEQVIIVGGAKVFSFRLHHPQGAWGYRVEHEGRCIVYASDHEHGNSICDQGLRRAARNADILIYDAHFTPAEYFRHRGWGHSTWLEGARLAKEVGVKRLLLFHHSPDRSDAQVESITAKARMIFPATVAAREGLVLKLW
jgi:phosphoribosyl 1,2-cyclic phosphodiesterase